MRKFGLIGRSLGHSFSKRFFTEKFAEWGENASYENIELAEIDEVKVVLSSNEYSGFSVTIPYKEAIIPFLDGLSESAKAIGAVNCVVKENEQWIGHNTDAFGFHQSIKPFLTNLHERALIIGTGGASKAVAHVFKQIGVDVLFVSRQPKADNEFTYDQVNEHMLNACKVIVNCSPIGTFPNVDELVVLPYAFLTPDHLLVDLVYNPAETAFMKAGRANGATALNGESMLKEQALKAWSLWNQ